MKNNSMTDEEINIAIAEKCGYDDVKQGIAEGTIKVITGFKEPWQDEEIPDYCNDLNAMHEAEVSCIIPMTTSCFYDTLQSIIFRDKEMTDENPKIFSGWLTHATARQRAEAFVRTLGLCNNQPCA